MPHHVSVTVAEGSYDDVNYRLARKDYRISLNLPVYVYDLFMSNLTMYIVCLHLKDDFGTWYTLPIRIVGTYTVNLAPEPWIISLGSNCYQVEPGLLM